MCSTALDTTTDKLLKTNDTKISCDIFVYAFEHTRTRYIYFCVCTMCTYSTS